MVKSGGPRFFCPGFSRLGCRSYGLPCFERSESNGCSAFSRRSISRLCSLDVGPSKIPNWTDVEPLWAESFEQHGLLLHEIIVWVGVVLCRTRRGSVSR